MCCLSLIRSPQFVLCTPPIHLHPPTPALLSPLPASCARQLTSPCMATSLCCSSSILCRKLTPQHAKPARHSPTRCGGRSSSMRIWGESIPLSLLTGNRSLHTSKGHPSALSSCISPARGGSGARGERPQCGERQEVSLCRCGVKGVSSREASLASRGRHHSLSTPRLSPSTSPLAGRGPLSAHMAAEVRWASSAFSVFAWELSTSSCN